MSRRPRRHSGQSSGRSSGSEARTGEALRGSGRCPRRLDRHRAAHRARPDADWQPTAWFALGVGKRGPRGPASSGALGGPGRRLWSAWTAQSWLPCRASLVQSPDPILVAGDPAKLARAVGQPRSRRILPLAVGAAARHSERRSRVTGSGPRSPDRGLPPSRETAAHDPPPSLASRAQPQAGDSGRLS